MDTDISLLSLLFDRAEMFYSLISVLTWVINHALFHWKVKVLQLHSFFFLTVKRVTTRDLVKDQLHWLVFGHKENMMSLLQTKTFMLIFNHIKNIGSQG